MSDPLSITASVIGVAQLGCAVAKGLYQIADDIGTAGLEVRLHAQEVDGFSKLLVRLQYTIDDLDLKTQRRQAAELRSHIGVLLVTCQKILQPMKDEIECSLQPLLVRFRESPTKLIQVALRIRWCFVSKGKIMFWREFLQAQHRLLDTSLLQAIYISNSTTRSTEDATSMLRASLENSYTSLNNPTMKTGSVQGKLLLAAPPGSAPGKSVRTKLDSPKKDQEDGDPGNSLDSFSKDFILSDDMSLALLNAPPSLPEPDLVGMTDEEIRSVKAATSIEMDDLTGKNMTQIFLETDAAERHALEMVNTALEDDKKNPSRDASVIRQPVTASSGYESCGFEQIGEWVMSRKRRFHASKMRMEVQYEVPVIFLCPPGNNRGPLGIKDQPIPLWFVEGTTLSEDCTRTPSMEREERLEESHLRPKELERGGIRAAAGQRAGWYTLLQELHQMERTTRDWQEITLRGERYEQGPAMEYALQRHVAGWEARSCAVALQPMRQSWDALPASLKRPCARTDICHVVEIAAWLGIYWKVFDRAGGIYFAEGNGYSLSGCHEPGVGVLFDFGSNRLHTHAQRRLIPTSDICAMSCGKIRVLTTLVSSTGLDTQSDVWETVDVGHESSISDLLASLGCELRLVTAMGSQHDKQSHLFPVAFEIIGMLAKISYIPDSYLRRLPNPTIFIWNRLHFSIQKLILEFHSSLAANHRIQETPHILALRGWADEVVLAIRDLVEPGQRPGSDSKSFVPLLALSILNRAIQKCDQFLLASSAVKSVRDLVLRFHFNEVLRFLGESRYEQTYFDVGNYEKLMSAGPETRQAVLINVYFSIILPRVAAACGQAEGNDGELATEIWCTLVFRMLCWLFLHDFDKEDVQVGDVSEMYGSKIEVYLS